MKQVLIAAPISAFFKLALLQHGYELVEIEDHTTATSIQYQLIYGIITSNKLSLQQESLVLYPNLKWIGRLGSGMEIIDTAYCDRQGIQYFSSPNGIANSVAEHSMGMLLSLLHNIHSSHNEIVQHKWIREANRGIELSGLTVGIIGYGHTGSAFAQKCAAFTNHILVFDKYKQLSSESYIQAVGLAELCERVDILSFHIPLNEETIFYYNDDFLRGMRKPHILINTSRGKIASTKTILNGLQSGKIIGACLDVLEEEKNIETCLQQPNHLIHELLKQRVIMTPHIAGYSFNAIEKMSDELYQQLKSVL